MSRRSLIQTSVVSILSLLLPNTVHALRPGKPSKEELLERMNRKKSPEEIAEEKEWVREEKRKRLEKQRELEASRGKDTDGNKVDLEGNLRANYYFPTSRKRYLPRVKRALEECKRIREDIGKGEWNTIQRKVENVLQDAVLPMKLYVSSLAGQGLALNVSFAGQMAANADGYEAALKKLKRAVSRKNESDAMSALNTMETSIAEYRKAGKLEADDFGIGIIPKDARVGSGFGNNNPALYNKDLEEIEK